MARNRFIRRANTGRITADKSAVMNKARWEADRLRRDADLAEHTGKPCYAASALKNLKSGQMPRPRINPDAHRKDIALTLPPQLIERAKIVCEIGGWSVSSVVEKALTNYLNALDREIGRKCAELSLPNARAVTPGANEKPLK